MTNKLQLITRAQSLKSFAARIEANINRDNASGEYSPETQAEIAKDIAEMESDLLALRSLFGYPVSAVRLVCQNTFAPSPEVVDMQEEYLRSTEEWVKAQI